MFGSDEARPATAAQPTRGDPDWCLIKNAAVPKMQLRLNVCTIYTHISHLYGEQCVEIVYL